MGEWKTVFEDEVEGRLVTVRVYETEQDEDEDDGLPMRVVATPVDDYEDGPEQSEEGQTLATKPKVADGPITLEPSTLDDLEEGLIEVGFSPKAAAWIAEKIPE